jgi:hypothetical protein
MTSLQQLALYGIVLVKCEAVALGRPWESLQQLCVGGLTLSPGDNRNGVLQLAPKVKGYELMRNGHVSGLTDLVGLTRLVVTFSGDVPAGMADALAALTGLQHLSLKGAGGSLPAAVQLAAEVSTLRHLQLDGGRDLMPTALSASLGECTQLTSMVLMGEKFENALPGLQQLSGLRSLTVPAELLGEEAGAWLVPLTALIRLGVALRDEMGLVMGMAMFGPPTAGPPVEAAAEPRSMALVQQHLSGVEVWPASLQHVVFVVEGTDINPKPRCWRFGPSATSSAVFTVWVEQQLGSAPGWARPFRPCPHLPGVWELQEEVQGSCWP